MQKGRCESVKSDHDHLIEMKITLIKEVKISGLREPTSSLTAKYGAA